MIARTVSVGGSTVHRTRRCFVDGNLEAALSEAPRPGAARKLSGKETALLVATAYSNSPAGRKRWTLDPGATHEISCRLHIEFAGYPARSLSM